MHPIRELYDVLDIVLLASLRGMIVLNFIKSFSWNRFSTRFSASPPLSLSSSLLSSWLTGWQSTRLSSLIIGCENVFRFKFMQNCWKMVATVNEPSTPAQARIRSRSQTDLACLMRLWRIFYAIVSCSINLENAEEARCDAMRYETKRPFRLVKYWLLVFENGFQIEIGNGYGAWDSWTTDGLRLITLSWGLDRSDWRLPPIIICICMRETKIVARSYDRETIYRSIDHGTHNCRSLKENMRYLMYMMESA